MIPIARFYEKKLPRPAAALAALLSVGGAAVALLWLLLPPVYRQLTALVQALPDAIARLADWVGGLRRWVQARVPAFALPEVDAAGLLGPLSGLAGGTVSLAVNLADGIGTLSMAAVLAFFFLCERERLLLRLELLLPQAVRPTAVRMGNAVCRELRLYLQGQLLVAGAVSLLSIAALIYVVNPMDIVPDFMIGIGQLDDAAAIVLVLQMIQMDLNKYKKWQKENGKR